MRLLLIDFGSSAISGQTRTPTKSEPWNAPELEATMRNLDHDELVQIDLYSFGLVCLHLLLPLESLASAKLCLIRTQRQTDDQWAQFLSQMRHKKAFEDGEDLAFQILDAIESADASQDQKYVLKKIVESTIQPPAGKRTLPWHQLLPYIQKHLSNRQVQRFLPKATKNRTYTYFSQATTRTLGLSCTHHLWHLARLPLHTRSIAFLT